MSPERFKQTYTSPQNDIWKAFGIFVKIITAYPLNHTEPILIINILHTIIFIGAKPTSEYFPEVLNDSNYRQEILSRTLCAHNNRSKSQEIVKLCQLLLRFGFNSNQPSDTTRSSLTHSTENNVTGLVDLPVVESIHLSSSHNVSANSERLPISTSEYDC